MLLVLLENAGRRSEEAVHEKLNVLAQGLAALMKSDGRTTLTFKRPTASFTEAVGLEERH